MNRARIDPAAVVTCGWIAAALVLMPVACSRSEPSPAVSGPDVAKLPSEYVRGETLFDANCAGCHGTRAVGTDHGPSFLSRIYEPNHHADVSFFMAVRRGVTAHHGTFGNMPPILGVSDDDVAEIVGYVRWLQRRAGIS